MSLPSTLSEVLAHEWYDLPLELVSDIIEYANPIREVNADAITFDGMHYSSSVIESRYALFKQNHCVTVDECDDDSRTITYLMGGIIVYTCNVTSETTYLLSEDDVYAQIICQPGHWFRGMIDEMIVHWD